MRTRAAPKIAMLFAASTLWAANACGTFSAADGADTADGAADGGPGGEGSIGPDGTASDGPRRIYVIGGEIADTTVDAGYGFTKRVFYATQQTGGALGAWAETMPGLSLVHGNAAVASSGAVVTLAGEVSTTFGTTAIMATSRAAILGEGMLDNWSDDTRPLLEPLYFHAAVAVNGRVYVIGGAEVGLGPVTNVRYATLAAEGTIGPWADAAPLPVTRNRLAAATDGVHIFVVGGLTFTDGGNECVPDVLVGTLGPNGEIVSWKPTGQTLATEGPAAAVFANKLYVLGGFDCGPPGTSKKVHIADIHGDGTLGAFTLGTPLPSGSSGLGAVVLGQHLYAVGGNDGETRVPDVFIADLDSTGDYGTWRIGSPLPVGASYFGIAAH